MPEQYERNGRWYTRPTKQEMRDYKASQERQGLRLAQYQNEMGHTVQYWINDGQTVDATHRILPKEGD